MHERAEERLGPNTCGLVEENSNVLFEKDGLGVCGWRRCVAGDAAASEGMSETLANLFDPRPERGRSMADRRTALALE
tara:strand:- start:22 stop:255 length:234 start_codon:yes stop_codon:yes gene_type:complete